MFPAVAATIIAVTHGLAGVGCGPARTRPHDAGGAALRLADHCHPWGRWDSVPVWRQPAVALHDRRHRTSDSTVICQLHECDGQIITVGSFPLASGHGSWGSPEPDQAAGITSARLTTLDGTIVATATFSATR